MDAVMDAASSVAANSVFEPFTPAPFEFPLRRQPDMLDKSMATTPKLVNDRRVRTGFMERTALAPNAKANVPGPLQPLHAAPRSEKGRRVGNLGKVRNRKVIAP